VTAKSFSPRKSKLDEYRDIIGTLSDKDVATRADVTAENVRTYRLRRSIPASWRGETMEQLEAKRGKGNATAPADPETAAPRRKRRASALDPYQDQLGHVPDRRLADMAGVSAENVRAYRKRHGIPAYWRGAPADAALAAPTPPSAATPPKPRAPTAGSNGATTGRRYAYKVSAEVQGTTREYVAFGSDMAEAAAIATQRLETLHPGALLRAISIVGVAL
jgi:hypothetical protein